MKTYVEKLNQRRVSAVKKVIINKWRKEIMAKGRKEWRNVVNIVAASA